MRVIGGTARGARLQSPKGTEVRPMLDRVKEALFNILSDRLPDADVLDLFSGTGSLGIEALSRGAKHAVFVESDRRCADCIDQNLGHTRFAERARIIRCSVLRSVPALTKLGRRFDLVLVDPPYKMTGSTSAQKPLEAMLERAAQEDLFSADAVLMIHHGRRMFAVSPPLPFEIFDERWYGQSGLAFLRMRSRENDVGA